jgi:hypothetical protein
VVVQFGGCDGKIPNCLPIMKGWNYMVWLGNWKFPEPLASELTGRANVRLWHFSDTPPALTIVRYRG